MSTADLEQFILKRVPRRSNLDSAVLEFAARSRGLDVERYDKTLVVVRFRDALVPFIGMTGPDTSRVGRLLCEYLDGQRDLLASAGLPVARSGTFVTAQPSRAQLFAEDLGWRVNVIAARHPISSACWTNVTSKDEFEAAWTEACRAYKEAPSRIPVKSVLIEERLAADRLRAFVVDDKVVSVVRDTQAIPTGGERVNDTVLRQNSSQVIDLTEETEYDAKALAVRALASVPGLAYGQVDLVDLGVTDGLVSQRYCVDRVKCASVSVAYFSSQDILLELAGAVLGHYQFAARWKLPRGIETRLQSAAEDLSSEPLHTGYVA